jgi:hypothetical protein
MPLEQPVKDCSNYGFKLESGAMGVLFQDMRMGCVKT